MADVAIDGGLFSAVGGDIGPGRREIDATGMFVLPGFVDMHAHLTPGELLLNLAAGVTSVRDVGNSYAELAELRTEELALRDREWLASTSND